MTAQEIISEVRQICQELDPNNTHASDTVILGWINACTLQLCSTIMTLPKSAVTGLVAADIVTMPAAMLRMDYVSISDGGSPAKHYNLATIDFSNFIRICNGWEDAVDDRPSMLVRLTDTTWMMYPPPDATWAGRALTIYGSVLPTALTSSGQTPPISIAMHPAYVHYCAWKFFLLINNPERAAASFAAYDGLRKLNTQTATSTTGSQLSFKIRGA